MKVIIFGAGVVGTVLGQHIAYEGHDVYIIERDPWVARHANSLMDVRVIQGDAEDPELLKEVGIDTADVVLAVTNSDSANIIMTLIVRARNPEATIITRVKGEQFTTNKDLWKGETFNRTFVISPEHAAADRILDLLQVPMAFDVVPFLDGAVRIASFRLRSESPLIGQKLMDVDRAQGGARTLVVGVEQADGTVLIPNGGYVFQPLDRISLLLLAGQDLSPSFRLMGVKYRQEGRIVIGGGGKLGLYIARKLEAAGYAPVVIENGRDRCAMLAQQLNNSIVLCGDLTDAELLTDEAENADNFIALTGHQEVNFLVSLLARKVGARRAITLMDNEAYLGMAATMGIDATISPKQSAVGTIFRVIRQSTVLDAALLMNGKLDALLVEVQAGSVLTRGPLKDAALPKGVVAALAERGGQLLVPDGNFTYLPKDKALFVTLRETMSMVDGLVAAKKG